MADTTKVLELNPAVYSCMPLRGVEIARLDIGGQCQVLAARTKKHAQLLLHWPCPKVA